MSLPPRPQLGSHVRPRRHLSEGGDIIVLHHGERDALLAVGPREWTVVQALDGTRDLEGIRIALRHEGVAVSVAQLSHFVRQLGSLGLLAASDAVVTKTSVGTAPRDVPLELMPGWGFDCDGSGACCSSFATVLFTPREVAAAQVVGAEARGAPVNPAELFTPERGLDRELLAVARKDGDCAFLRQGVCGLHAAGGPRMKPAGCRTFPLRFLDVGSTIRVGPAHACACTFRPSSARPIDAIRGSELPITTHVRALGQMRVGSEILSGDSLLSRLAELDPPETEIAAWCESTAERLDGKTTTHSTSIREGASRLARRLRQLPGEPGFTVRAATALAEASESGEDATPGEAEYLRAKIWIPPGDASLAQMLRTTASRIRLARGLSFDDPRGEFPLAVVEALCEGYGLGGLD